MEKVELLSPVGDFECLKAAVQNGANSVYLGASSFSARAKATNFDLEELKQAITYAKLRNVTVHLALNTLIKNEEFEDAVKLAIYSYNLGVDAIIIQDLGLASFLHENYPDIVLHGSTQMTVHNLEGVKQLEKLGFKRVVLSRELNIDEIKYIRENTNIELEVFAHGALCISYSGQCLFSSVIGGRSGNRGLCAQPCRLPYELTDSRGNSLDKGYLLSPRDNLGIEYLPELIKMGINSFKIEGRMKTPYYVAVVTKIYRKYIDYIEKNLDKPIEQLKDDLNKLINKKNEDSLLSDKEELMQVFNRGGFSTGHFSPNGNRNLIFKDKPNNMGFFLGTIQHVNENKGHIKIKLEDRISIGDRISINNESYTVSELMINNKNFETQEKGSIVVLGRMKGDIRVGQKVYRIESSKLNKLISPSFKEDKNFKKIKLNGKLIVKGNQNIKLIITSSDGPFFNDFYFEKISDIIPEKSINRPITKEKLMEQISKTGSTEFEFENIEIDLDDNLFIPKISMLNEFRRTSLEEIENIIITKYTHNLEFKNINFPKENNTKSNNENISLLLNYIDLNLNYLDLKNFDKLYIPLKYFINNNYSSKIKDLCNNFNTYIYMPHILKINFINTLNLDKIVKDYNIKGFVISHISELELTNKFHLEAISNFNLNIYNSFTIKKLESMRINTISISPELTSLETNSIIDTLNINSESIIYGKLPIMTNAYCYLGKSNKCYKECDKKCLLNEKYSLKDRMNFNFRIIPDNTSTITTIYNSKILSVKKSELNSNSYRIDILDESLDTIQEVINKVRTNNRFEGKEYTNWNY